MEEHSDFDIQEFKKIDLNNAASINHQQVGGNKIALFDLKNVFKSSTPKVTPLREVIKKKVKKQVQKGLSQSPYSFEHQKSISEISSNAPYPVYQNVVDELQKQTPSYLNLEHMNQLINFMESRKPFNFRPKQIFNYFLLCMPCRSGKSLWQHTTYRQHMLYKKGIQKLKEDLDARHLIKTVHRMRIFQQILFSRRQKLMIKFAKKSVIDSASSVTDSDQNNMDAIALIDHKNHLVNQPMRLRVEQSLKELVNVGKECPEMNKRILQAIFSRTIKDYPADFDVKNNQDALPKNKPSKKMKQQSNYSKYNDEEMKVEEVASKRTSKISKSYQQVRIQEFAMEGTESNRPLNQDEYEKTGLPGGENMSAIELTKKDANIQQSMSRLVQAQQNQLNKETFVENRHETEEHLLTQDPHLTFEDDPKIPMHNKHTVDVPKLKMVAQSQDLRKTKSEFVNMKFEEAETPADNSIMSSLSREMQTLEQDILSMVNQEENSVARAQM